MRWSLVALVMLSACSRSQEVTVLDTVAHSLYTHCGIEYTEVDGQYLVAEVSDPPLLPFETPMRWQDPFDEGTLTMRSDGSAVYHGDMGLIVHFKPAPIFFEPPGCY